MALNYVQGAVPPGLVFVASPAGVYTSGPLENAGEAKMVDILAYVSAATGTTVTLDVLVQSSPDGVTWSTILGSAITTITAAGSARSCVLVSSEYVQIQATIGGTGTPLVTGAVGALIVS